jgi:hypothetical protein
MMFSTCVAVCAGNRHQSHRLSTNALCMCGCGLRTGIIHLSFGKIVVLTILPEMVRVFVADNGAFLDLWVFVAEWQ